MSSFLKKAKRVGVKLNRYAMRNFDALNVVCYLGAGVGVFVKG
jgi:hypothetical protein